VLKISSVAGPLHQRVIDRWTAGGPKILSSRPQLSMCSSLTKRQRPRF